MFQNLSQKLTGILGNLRKRGVLTEADIDTAMREVRIALLEADVALPVVKDFVNSLKNKALGAEIIASVSPAQMVIKLVNDHLRELLGSETQALNLSANPPVVVMMVGLQGSGKTTSTGKLALRLQTKQNKRVLVASLDIYRPAAQQQLEQVAILAYAAPADKGCLLRADDAGEDGTEAVAVMGLFSFLNPAHERRIGELLAEELPGVPVTLSSDVVPEFREYPRASTAVANARLRRKIEEEAATRAELSRFLSPALVEKAVNNELDLTKAGDLVQATVLFSDIRGFTTISDGARPEHIVSMLNEYFDAMVEVVFAFGGTLDKFLGDGMMAVWGTPVQAWDDAIRAVKAANAMRRALRDIVNAARTSRGEMPLSVGYGIATGRVVAGAMGARRRLDFTVIGDTVNLSSRLCGQAKPGQILVDDATNGIILGAGLQTTALEPRQVKGVARPVPVFDVHDDSERDPFETASLEFALPPTR